MIKFKYFIFFTQLNLLLIFSSCNSNEIRLNPRNLKKKDNIVAVEKIQEDDQNVSVEQINSSLDSIIHRPASLSVCFIHKTCVKRPVLQTNSILHSNDVRPLFRHYAQIHTASGRSAKRRRTAEYAA